MTVSCHSPAKLNLHLHVTGLLDNGYHLLDSLTVFVDLTDTLTLTPSADFMVTVSPSDIVLDDNLVTRAAHLLAQKFHIRPHGHIHLQKNIPLGAGLGGGSGNAASTLKLLAEYWGIKAHWDDLVSVASVLGSDIVACLHQKPLIMRGTGNEIVSPPHLPKLYGVLVNPLTLCPTPQVYKTYDTMPPSYHPPVEFPHKFETIQSLCEFLSAHTYNDLTDAACHINPMVRDILTTLQHHNLCLLSRMTGSGSTCFALCADKLSAENLVRDLKKTHQKWWVRKYETIS
jgi:4-diphosphocytidyl-2-C-methyl-D-erythritol kinase